MIKIIDKIIRWVWWAYHKMEFNELEGDNQLNMKYRKFLNLICLLNQMSD